MNTKLRTLLQQLPILMLLALATLPARTVRAQSADFNPDTLYQQYITDDVREQMEKFQQLEERLQQQEQEKEQRRTRWYIAVGICALVALTPTFVVFGSFRQRLKERPSKSNIAKAAFICLGGGIVIFLIDILWLYLTFEATMQVQKLAVFLILLVLGIALWIYTKNLNKYKK